MITLMLKQLETFVGIHIYLIRYVSFIFVPNVYVCNLEFYFAFFKLLLLLGQGMQMKYLIRMQPCQIIFLGAVLLILDILLFVTCLVFRVWLIVPFLTITLLLGYLSYFKCPQMNPLLIPLRLQKKKKHIQLRF